MGVHTFKKPYAIALFALAFLGESALAEGALPSQEEAILHVAKMQKRNLAKKPKRRVPPPKTSSEVPEIDEAEFEAAYVEDMGRFELVPYAGLNVPSKADASPRLAYGLEFNHRFRTHSSLGLSFELSRETIEGTNQRFRFNLSQFAFHALFHAPEGFFEGFYAGPQIGLIRIDFLSQIGQSPASQEKSTVIVVGPKSGFAFGISESLLAFSELKMQFVPNTELVPSFWLMSFFGGIRYRF